MPATFGATQLPTLQISDDSSRNAFMEGVKNKAQSLHMGAAGPAPFGAAGCCPAAPHPGVPMTYAQRGSSYPPMAPAASAAEGASRADRYVVGRHHGPTLVYETNAAKVPGDETLLRQIRDNAGRVD